MRAHTVRRAADLKAIARKGHVYQTSADLADLRRNKGRLLPKLVGINEASTFWGFCARHDAATFAPLESQCFEFTAEQAFLLAYRPLCKELYLKKRQIEVFGVTREMDKGRSQAAQVQLQEFVTLAEIGAAAAIKDLEHHKASFDADLLTHDFSRVRYVAIEFDRVPDLMCSSVVQPHYTFDGRLLQDLGNLDETLDFMSFSLIATDSGGASVVAWRDDSDRASAAFVDSLLTIAPDELPSAIVRYATSEFENTYFAPEWWDHLTGRERDAIISRLTHNVGPTNQVSSDYLADDGLRPVNWRVTNIRDNRS